MSEEKDKSSIPTNYEENKSLMFDSVSKEAKHSDSFNQFSLDVIVLIHALNIEKGLTPINSDDEEVVFDNSWYMSSEGVYKLRYKLDNPKRIILFRFIEQGGRNFGINFCIEGDTDLFTFQAEEGESLEIVARNHLNELSRLVPIRSQQNQREAPRHMPFSQRVPLNQPGNNDPLVRPLPLNRPENFPFNNPFGQQEYVGPNSSIFSNRNDRPNFGDRNPNQRYDPIDPFDKGPNLGPFGNRPSNGNQFQGFDEFGRPIGKSNQNPFGGRGGFGSHNPFNGGFGGDFGGGFGGGNNFF